MKTFGFFGLDCCVCVGGCDEDCEEGDGGGCWESWEGEEELNWWEGEGEGEGED